MNLGSDFRNATLDGLRDVLESWWARINTMWKKEHDPETGGHTDVTANSVTADTVTVNEYLVVVPPDPSPPGQSALLTVEETELGKHVVIAADYQQIPVQVTSISRASGGSGASVAITLDGEFNPILTNLPASAVVPSGIFVTASGGTHALIATLQVVQPVVVSGGATVTNTATVYIPDASVATVSGVNYALWVDAGQSRFDGLINAVGGQIQFPATQVSSANANTLDDYEEGTFTPTSPNITYTLAAGVYQKVGLWVKVSGVLVFPATADANQAEINNMPFTCENSTPSRGGGVAPYCTAGILAGFLMVNNTTRAQIFNPATGANVTNAAMTGATVFFDFQYPATA